MIYCVCNSQIANTRVFPGNKQYYKFDQSAQAGAINCVPSYDADTVEIGANTQTKVDYTKPAGKNCDDATIEKIKQQANMATEQLRSIVEKLMRKQGKISEYSVNDLNDINQAKQTILEDGEFGVKAVNDRIVDFAINISGNDKTKLDEIKSAIEDGFEEARKAFGGTLPDICNQTHDEIIKKLDQWAKTTD